MARLAGWDGAPAEDCNGNGIADSCDIFDGVSRDCDGDGVPDECEDFCRWDTQPGVGDCFVGLDDLTALLSNWGPCDEPCELDFMPPGGDGYVSLDDLTAVLSNWGPCS
jgi:hypothetical protein